MKWDFQKLLIANANLRLMIFELCKTDDFEHLNQYFEEAINNFEELKNGAQFLIITFYNDTFLYKIIKKRVKPTISWNRGQTLASVFSCRNSLIFASVSTR